MHCVLLHQDEDSIEKTYGFDEVQIFDCRIMDYQAHLEDGVHTPLQDEVVTIYDFVFVSLVQLKCRRHHHCHLPHPR